MADRVNETPKTTQELVEIQEFMKTVINIFELKKKPRNYNSNCPKSCLLQCVTSNNIIFE